MDKLEKTERKEWVEERSGFPPEVPWVSEDEVWRAILDSYRLEPFVKRKSPFVPILLNSNLGGEYILKSSICSINQFSGPNVAKQKS